VENIIPTLLHRSCVVSVKVKGKVVPVLFSTEHQAMKAHGGVVV